VQSVEGGGGKSGFDSCAAAADYNDDVKMTLKT
jgi:hypothetical protein